MPISRRDFVKSASAAAALTAIGSQADALQTSAHIFVPEHPLGAADFRELAQRGDGKGQPAQSNAVSHGCVPARFRQINVINTGRTA